MEEIQTQHFGTVSYEPQQVIHFPAGLPAFEEERRFLPIEQPATAPVIFLQSLCRPDLAFITLPVELIDAAYRLEISPEDLDTLGTPLTASPSVGKDVLCLAIITVAESGLATANLLAPVVINLQTRCAVQVIQAEAGYSHMHPLPGTEGEAEC